MPIKAEFLRHPDKVLEHILKLKNLSKSTLATRLGYASPVSVYTAGRTLSKATLQDWCEKLGIPMDSLPNELLEIANGNEKEVLPPQKSTPQAASGGPSEETGHDDSSLKEEQDETINLDKDRDSARGAAWIDTEATGLLTGMVQSESDADETPATGNNDKPVIPQTQGVQGAGTITNDELRLVMWASYISGSTRGDGNGAAALVGRLMFACSDGSLLTNCTLTPEGIIVLDFKSGARHEIRLCEVAYE